MLSVIIPTLFRCDLLFESLQRFERDLTDNDEVILIDNANSSHDFNSSKIRHLKYATNNFVNKSWNIGVTESKNDLLVIANDDVVFDYNCYKHNIVEFFENKPNVGLIGSNKSNLSRPGHINVNQPTDVLEFVETSKRITGFGMLMAIQKQNYIAIPDVLQVFHGDDYLFDKQKFNNKANYICSVKMHGYVSKTSEKFLHHAKLERKHYRAL